MAAPASNILIVDAFAFIYRAYHANPNLDNGAAFFFTRMLMALLETQKPTHVAVVFDLEGSMHRERLHPGYKGTRNERPAVLDNQLPLIKEIVTKLGCHVVELAGVEADDLIGSVAFCAARLDFDKVVIASPDKDMLQLVNDRAHISVLNVKENIPLVYDEAGVKARLGVNPDQVVDYLTLTGDASDAIQGVPGIGEKGAAGLLEKHGSLWGILAVKGSLKASYKEGIAQHLDKLAITRSLVTIVTDMALPVYPGQCTYVQPPNHELGFYFRSKGFPSLVPKASMDDDL
jgi:DNA polymerase-1